MKRFEEFVSTMALEGVEPRPIPQETILRALLAQNGHYVCEEIVELMAVAGVAPSSGCVLVTHHEAPLEILPPGYAVRSRGILSAIFYPEYGTRPWQINESDRDAFYALARDEVSVLLPCRIACDRWGQPEPDLLAGLRQRENCRHYPWEASTHDPVSPAHMHGRLFAQGRLPGIMAVAAGRLDSYVHGILPARWMFPVEEPRSEEQT